MGRHEAPSLTAYLAARDQAFLTDVQTLTGCHGAADLRAWFAEHRPGHQVWKGDNMYAHAFGLLSALAGELIFTIERQRAEIARLTDPQPPPPVFTCAGVHDYGDGHTCMWCGEPRG